MYRLVNFELARVDRKILARVRGAVDETVDHLVTAPLVAALETVAKPAELEKKRSLPSLIELISRDLKAATTAQAQVTAAATEGLADDLDEHYRVTALAKGVLVSPEPYVALISATEVEAAAEQGIVERVRRAGRRTVNPAEFEPRAWRAEAELQRAVAERWHAQLAATARLLLVLAVPLTIIGTEPLGPWDRVIARGWPAVAGAPWHVIIPAATFALFGAAIASVTAGFSLVMLASPWFRGHRIAARRHELMDRALAWIRAHAGRLVHVGTAEVHAWLRGELERRRDERVIAATDHAERYRSAERLRAQWERITLSPLYQGRSVSEPRTGATSVLHGAELQALSVEIGPAEPAGRLAAFARRCAEERERAVRVCHAGADGIRDELRAWIGQAVQGRLARGVAHVFTTTLGESERLRRFRLLERLALPAVRLQPSARPLLDAVIALPASDDGRPTVLDELAATELMDPVVATSLSAHRVDLVYVTRDWLSLAELVNVGDTTSHALEADLAGVLDQLPSPQARALVQEHGILAEAFAVEERPTAA